VTSQHDAHRPDEREVEGSILLPRPSGATQEDEHDHSGDDEHASGREGEIQGSKATASRR
jgi:hypothetical protein